MTNQNRYDFVIEKGATFTKQLRWKDSSGVVINLTGYTARMQIRETTDSDTTIVSLTSGSGITLGGVLGTIDLLISDTVTSAITQNVGVYDLELVSGSGVVTRLLEGNVQFTDEVTR